MCPSVPEIRLHMASTSDRLVLIKCNDLEIGMYIAELDRSWLQTPFANRGFLITLASQIETLQRCCDYVYVDPLRSDTSLQRYLDRERLLRGALIHSRQIDGPDALTEVRKALRNAGTLVSRTIHEARRNGHIELESVYTGLVAFLDSTLKNADGMQWLMATETVPGFLSRRALGTSMLCILFGKHLGFDRHELLHLALGGLLLDIGKVNVPITILAKPDRLNTEEKWFTNRHVRESLAMMHFNGESLERVFSMIAAHHERLDGSGYPNQIVGTDIPLYARIAGIADTFDALTLNRRYAPARSSYSALRFLGALRRTKFDAALVDEFIDSLGAYPTGTRVQLHDGSTGLVINQNIGQLGQPDVLLTNDATGRPVKTARIVTVDATQSITKTFPVPNPQ